jgi:hypothetical protein
MGIYREVIISVLRIDEGGTQKGSSPSLQTFTVKYNDISEFVCLPGSTNTHHVYLHISMMFKPAP